MRTQSRTKTIFGISAVLLTIGFAAWAQNLNMSGQLTASGPGVHSFMGNVGIGTTTPTSSLHVIGGSNWQGTIRAETNSYYSSFGLWAGGVFRGSIYYHPAVPGVIFNSGVDTMTLTSSGNVGIGTTSPGAKLDVNGSVRVMGSNAIYFQNATADANATISATGGSGISTLSLNATGGNVGIGTSTPASKLEVNGSIGSAGGQVRRDFLTFNTTANNKTNIHIKTNIKKQTSIMYRILVEGYNYGANAPISSDAVGYTYSGFTCVDNQVNTNYASGLSIAQYCSSDGYVTLRLTNASSFYFAGFTVSAWFVNPAGIATNISATAVQQAADL